MCPCTTKNKWVALWIKIARLMNLSTFLFSERNTLFKHDTNLNMLGFLTLQDVIANFLILLLKV